MGGRSPFTGAAVMTLSPALAEQLRLDFGAEGAVVIEVEEGTPAQVLGLRRGDIIVSVNGRKVEDARALSRLSETPQRLWRIQINRGGRMMTTVISG